MNVKKLGFVIIIVGLIIILFIGFKYSKGERTIEKAGFQITKDVKQSVNWLSFIGIGVMIIGGIVYSSGKKKELKKNLN